MVCTFTIGSSWRASYCEVPFEKVRFERGGVQGWVRMGRKLGGFFEDALNGGGLGIESGEGHRGRCYDRGHLVSLKSTTPVEL
jgi:hypothetical protein